MKAIALREHGGPEVLREKLPLSRAADAHRILEDRAAFGKVVLEAG